MISFFTSHRRALAMLLVALFALNGCSAKPKTVEVGEIVSASVTLLLSGKTVECSADDVRTLQKIYSAATLHNDDGGTTHPYRADITLASGENLVLFSGGAANICAEIRNGKQSNIHGEGFTAWFALFEERIEVAKTPAPHETAPQATPEIAAATAYVLPEGMTISERIATPQGFTRSEGNVYEEFIRNQPLLADGSPVLLYDGTQKGNQGVHVAVLSIDVGERDRQQCADAALRLRCEFLFSTQQYSRINYHLTNGDEFPYEKYRDGYRLKVSGNDATLSKTAERDTSYDAFRKYCDTLFAYASTRSVERESKLIDASEMRVGDVFVIGGSPGHCVIVADMCENDDGEKLFLLAQSYMPAQQVHILKNPNATEAGNPWYSLSDLAYPFETPEWVFDAPCLRRMP